MPKEIFPKTKLTRGCRKSFFHYRRYSGLRDGLYSLKKLGGRKRGYVYLWWGILRVAVKEIHTPWQPTSAEKKKFCLNKVYSK